MEQKKVSVNEKLRRTALAQYAIFKSGQDRDYDQLTYLAAEICKVPVAKISIIGKKEVWSKSAYGTELSSIPRQNSFCELCIQSGERNLILNKPEHPEVFEKAKGLYDREYQFFAGVPLVNSQGHAIAVFGVFDVKPRTLKPNQLKSLEALANQSMNLFEARKQTYKLHHVQRSLKQKYRELEKFASLVSHDIKSPLANIISLTELLKEENEDKLDDQTKDYLNFLVDSSYSLRNYVDGILNFYRSDHILEKDYEDVDLPELLKPVVDLYNISDDIEINYPKTGKLQNINKAALTQVFMNLLSNSLKYNDKEQRKVNIRFRENNSYYYFEVEDNGNGIPPEKVDKAFELFATLDVNDRYGNPGSGIGLATVKKHIENMHGQIEVHSTPGVGSNFKFRIKRL
ncbi:sensor histidine kinase [Salegentibacter sediminis]|uniref:sensor histidine kinase n=1 Tax=Salegentibacter sediminis TaxID=1930251 RepID=UPI0009BE6B5B|nr:GAF domain-containing sensor histidine kinase [Salegentibacter sediminis]